jgi:hypothetical protein
MQVKSHVHSCFEKTVDWHQWHFLLNEKLDDKWLKWSPRIDIANANSAAAQDSPSSLLLNSVDSSSKQ